MNLSLTPRWHGPLLPTDNVPITVTPRCHGPLPCRHWTYCCNSHVTWSTSQQTLNLSLWHPDVMVHFTADNEPIAVTPRWHGPLHLGNEHIADSQVTWSTSRQIMKLSQWLTGDMVHFPADIEPITVTHRWHGPLPSRHWIYHSLCWIWITMLLLKTGCIHFYILSTPNCINKICTPSLQGLSGYIKTYIL